MHRALEILEFLTDTIEGRRQLGLEPLDIARCYHEEQVRREPCLLCWIHRERPQQREVFICSPREGGQDLPGERVRLPRQAREREAAAPIRPIRKRLLRCNGQNAYDDDHVFHVFLEVGMSLWPQLDVARIRIRENNVILGEIEGDAGLTELVEYARKCGAVGAILLEPVTVKDGPRRVDALTVRVSAHAEQPLPNNPLDPDEMERRREDLEVRRAEREGASRIMQANLSATTHAAELRIAQIEARAQMQLDEAARRYERELERKQAAWDDERARMQRAIDTMELDLREVRGRAEARIERAREEEQAIAARRLGTAEDLHARERATQQIELERAQRMIDDLRAEVALYRKNWTSAQAEMVDTHRQLAQAQGVQSGQLSRKVADLQALAQVARGTPELLPMVVQTMNPELAPSPIERAIERAVPIIDRVIALRGGAAPAITTSEDVDV